MLQEKSLDGCQYATGATLILENGIVQLLVEIEALVPRSVKGAFITAKQ